MSFSKDKIFVSSQPEPYYPNENERIRGLAKAEILEFLENEEFLKSFKEKLKAEIKAELLSEIKGENTEINKSC